MDGDNKIGGNYEVGTFFLGGGVHSKKKEFLSCFLFYLNFYSQKYV